MRTISVFLLFLTLSSMPLVGECSSPKPIKDIILNNPPEVADALLSGAYLNIETLISLVTLPTKKSEVRNIQRDALLLNFKNQVEVALLSAKHLRAEKTRFQSEYGLVCRTVMFNIPTFLHSQRVTREDVKAYGLRDLLVDGSEFCKDILSKGETLPDYSLISPPHAP